MSTALTETKTRKRGRGAPPANLNSWKHGLRAVLTAGKVPPKCSYVLRQCQAVRRAVEARILDACGEVNVEHALLIHSVVEWHKYGLLARHFLRTSFEKLSPTERLHFAKESARGFTERDRHFRSLALEPASSMTLAAFYSTPPDELAPPDEPASPLMSAGPETAPESFETDCGSEVQP